MNKLTKVVAYLRKEVEREFPLQQLHLLLEIAADEGLDTKELAARTEMGGGPVSRGVRKLAILFDREDGKIVEVGMGLVEIRTGRRQHTYWLSPKGKALMDTVRALLSCGDNQ